MDNEIKYIQNTLWAMYKEFISTHNVKKYTDQATELCKKYKERPELLSFCQNLVVTWTPIINLLAQQHRSQIGGDTDE